MRDQIATIASKRLVATETVEMEWRLEEAIDPCPGQFAHIAVKDVFLRRPIGIAGYDADKRLLRVIVQRIGRGTRTLTEMEIGETTKLLAPLGNPFPQAPPDESNEEEKIWLVGGGMGVAPMLYLARALFERRQPPHALRSFIGFRDKNFIFGADELERCGKIDLSVGGFVTDPFLEALEWECPSVVYACGPEPLLRNLQRICREKNLPAYVSLEERMGCGIGACLVCNCKVRAQSGFAYKRVCCDGPVFDLSEVMFA